MFKQKTHELKDLLLESKEFLTQLDYENALALIENNEGVLALELICEQLYEYDSQISHSLYSKIKAAGEQHKVEDRILNLVDRLKKD